MLEVDAWELLEYIGNDNTARLLRDGPPVSNCVDTTEEITFDNSTPFFVDIIEWSEEGVPMVIG